MITAKQDNLGLIFLHQVLPERQIIQLVNERVYLIGIPSNTGQHIYDKHCFKR